MSILTILLTLVIVAFVLWVINAYAPEPLRRVANLVIVALLVLWVVVMLFPGLAGLRVGR